MSKGDHIEALGRVTATPGGGLYTVELDVSGSVVLCTLGGRLRRNKIRVIPDDHVTVAISPYELSRGFITYRHR